jgi:hypothetical protein
MSYYEDEEEIPVPSEAEHPMYQGVSDITGRGCTCSVAEWETSEPSLDCPVHGQIAVMTLRQWHLDEPLTADTALEVWAGASSLSHEWHVAGVRLVAVESPGLQWALASLRSAGAQRAEGWLCTVGGGATRVELATWAVRDERGPELKLSQARVPAATIARRYSRVAVIDQDIRVTAARPSNAPAVMVGRTRRGYQVAYPAEPAAGIGCWPSGGWIEPAGYGAGAADCQYAPGLIPLGAVALYDRLGELIVAGLEYKFYASFAGADANGIPRQQYTGQWVRILGRAPEDDGDRQYWVLAPDGTVFEAFGGELTGRYRRSGDYFGPSPRRREMGLRTACPD